MAKLCLGINCGFATNRFPEPEVWLYIISKVLNLRYAQFVADLLNPFLPDEILIEEAQKIKFYAQKYNVCIQSTFTSAQTRTNHLMHPNPKIRKVWLNWFKRFIGLSAEIGAEACGSHFGSMSVSDYQDISRRNLLVESAIESWQELSEVAKSYGLKYLMIEPMSVPREFGATIDETKWLLEKVNAGSAIPILLNLDVDHGWAGSKDPKDTDPYQWLLQLGKYAPVIHIKQSTQDKSGHWPFTPEYNCQGIIKPKLVIEAIESSGAAAAILFLEIAHRERYPAEEKIIDDLKVSVEYWRNWIKK